jgi:hypothetical protein
MLTIVIAWIEDKIFFKLLLVLFLPSSLKPKKKKHIKEKQRKNIILEGT